MKLHVVSTVETAHYFNFLYEALLPILFTVSGFLGEGLNCVADSIF